MQKHIETMSIERVRFIITLCIWRDAVATAILIFMRNHRMDFKHFIKIQSKPSLAFP